MPSRAAVPRSPLPLCLRGATALQRSPLLAEVPARVMITSLAHAFGPKPKHVGRFGLDVDGHSLGAGLFQVGFCRRWRPSPHRG